MCAIVGDSTRGFVAVRELIAVLRDIDPAFADQLKASVVPQGGGGSGSYPATRALATPLDADRRQPLGSVQYGRLGVVPVLGEQQQQQLNELLEENRRADELIRAGLTPRRTLLLTGPPGVGKTMAARWLAEKLDLPLVEGNLAAIVSSFLGRTAQNIHELFDYARERPVALFLDEFDALSKQRDDALDVGEMKRAVSTLLLELDRAPQHGIVIAATNHPQLVDPAVLRRFDLRVDLSTVNAEVAPILLERHLGLPLDETLRAIVKVALAGFTGAQIKAIADSSRRRAVLEGGDLNAYVLTEVAKLASGSEVRRLVARALRELPGAGQSMGSIAAVLGVSKSTVHSYLKGDDHE